MVICAAKLSLSTELSAQHGDDDDYLRQRTPTPVERCRSEQFLRAEPIHPGPITAEAKEKPAV